MGGFFTHNVQQRLTVLVLTMGSSTTKNGDRPWSWDGLMKRMGGDRPWTVWLNVGDRPWTV